MKVYGLMCFDLSQSEWNGNNGTIGAKYNELGISALRNHNSNVSNFFCPVSHVLGSQSDTLIEKDRLRNACVVRFGTHTFDCVDRQESTFLNEFLIFFPLLRCMAKYYEFPIQHREYLLPNRPFVSHTHTHDIKLSSP